MAIRRAFSFFHCSTDSQPANVQHHHGVFFFQPPARRRDQVDLRADLARVRLVNIHEGLQAQFLFFQIGL